MPLSILNLDYEQRLRVKRQTRPINSSMCLLREARPLHPVLCPYPQYSAWAIRRVLYGSPLATSAIAATVYICRE